MNILQILTSVDEFFWGYVAFVLIASLGLLLSIRFRFFQIWHLPKIVKTFFHFLRHKSDGGRGIHPLKAFFASTGGMIGIGNVVGVTTAVQLGGPGALFWLWIAGVIGTYTGWRLVENGKQDVHIFEGSDRIGGRLYTTYLPGMPHVPVELGGVQFFPSQKAIANLVNYLQLPTTSCASPNQNNLLYVRGARFYERDEKQDLPYNLPPDEQSKSPDALMLYALHHIDPQISAKNWNTKKETARYKGESLYDVSWQSFLLETLSPEGFQLLVDVGAVQMMADASVATIASRLFRNKCEESLKLTKGYDGVPKELAKRFENRGGHIYLKHHLMSLSYEGGEENFRYRLLFYQEDGSFKPVYAKHVIFTITPPALKLLAQQSPALKNKTLHDNLNLLVPSHMTILYLGYDCPWWQEFELQKGLSNTTLPIQTCYYFESEEEMPDGEPGNRNALILASSQSLYTSFWSSHNEGEEFAPTIGMHSTRQAERQLAIMHGLDTTPKAYTGAFVDWSKAPNFGAHFFWKTGTRPEELMNYFQHPFVGERLYVIGSAYSLHPEWVEGALESSDALLKNYFFIDSPTW